MKSNPAPSSTALVQVPRAGPSVWDDVRLQKLWLATQKRGWRSLAILSAGRGVETIHVAEILAELVWRYRGQPSSVCDLRDLSMRLVEYQVREVQAQTDAGARVLIALRSIFENPTAAPIARQADAIILCIRLAKTELKAAEQTLAEVGREHVIGSIILRDQSKGR